MLKHWSMWRLSTAAAYTRTKQQLVTAVCVQMYLWPLSQGRYQRLPGNTAAGVSRCAWNGKVEHRSLHHACVLENKWTRDCHASV